jgi:hypothetical protein
LQTLDTPKAVVIGFALVAASIVYAATVVKPHDYYWFNDVASSFLVRVNARTLDADVCRFTIGKRTVSCEGLESVP